jgi:hypothetical protein
VPPGPPSPLTYTAPIAPASPPPGAVVDPGPDGWGPYGPASTPEGWFALLELDVVKPVLKDKLKSDNALGNGTGPIETPSSKLPWTVAPLFELGYRLPESAGYLSLGYRFLTDQGNSTPTIDDTPVNVRTRLTLNSIYFDYGAAPFEPIPRYQLGWRLGFQFSDIFFDSTATTPTLTEQSGNYFYGAGPHARLDLARHIVVVPGLDLFGRVDGAVLIGPVNQHFSLTTPNGSVAASSSETQRRYQSVPTLTLQAGVGYTPPSLPNLHLTTGYQFENYWYLAQLGETASGGVPPSRGELMTQGWFLRAQLDF